MEEKLEDILLDEIREVMFNEEFQTIARRNLFSMDGDDVADPCLGPHSIAQIALTVTPSRGVLRMVG